MVSVRRFSKLAAMMTMAVVLGASAAPAAPAKPATVDVFGYYYLRENEAPKGFQDISELYLSTVDYRDGKEVRVPLNGFIRLKPKKGKGAESAVVFTTREVGGVSYRFAGAFVKLGNFPQERPEDEIILKGHLIRLQGGKVAAEGDVGFRYTGGD
jgi:hypothetical protein